MRISFYQWVGMKTPSVCWALCACLWLSLHSRDVVAQVTFQPPGCDFRVWFVVPPNVTKATVPAGSGQSAETTIAELNPILDDGNAHYFRAECTEVAFGTVNAEMLSASMDELAELNGLVDARVWSEKLPSGQLVGRLRATVDSGLRIYHLDIRRYISERNLFDVWAGAEKYPTEGIVMFFRSVAYKGVEVHP